MFVYCSWNMDIKCPWNGEEVVSHMFKYNRNKLYWRFYNEKQVVHILMKTIHNPSYYPIETIKQMKSNSRYWFLCSHITNIWWNSRIYWNKEVVFHVYQEQIKFLQYILLWVMYCDSRKGLWEDSTKTRLLYESNHEVFPKKNCSMLLIQQKLRWLISMIRSDRTAKGINLWKYFRMRRKHPRKSRYSK